jgi:enamine deaminase RidA (YjgF/YER057c/UK114 family)
LGIKLPPVAKPAGSYVPAVVSGPLLFTAGQLPFVDGALLTTGKVGAAVSADEARDLARQCAINVLAAVESAIGVDHVVRVVKIVGFVASAPGFHGQPGVVNGASDLMVGVFGDAGRHARSAVGVAELPFNAPVEVEAIFEVETTR